MLKILHVLRSPVGGLFRHVIDLSRAQAARGHQVGIVADSSTGGARADAAFAGLSGQLALGLTRVPMSRHAGLSDLSAQRHVAHRARDAGADVLHGHGAKGGAYARLCGGRAIRVYTPHGGSLHYSRSSLVGLLYLTLERVLMARTELFLFESRYGRDAFTAILLVDDIVLVVGGDTGPQGMVVASTELFDPKLGAWTSTGGLNNGRFLHTGTLLMDGSVLVAGGSDGFGGVPISSAELYAP